MIQNINLDRTDTALGTSYPFTTDSSLNLNGSQLPANMFMCIQLYLDETHIPYAHVSTITKESVCFRDAAGAVIGYWFWRNIREKDESMLLDSYMTDFIFNAAGVITGHIAYSYLLPSLLVSIIKDTGVYEPSVDAFVLLPQCHVIIPKGAARKVTVNGTDIKQNTNATKNIIATDMYLDVKYDDTEYKSPIRIGVFNRPSVSPAADGITAIQINGGTAYACSDKHILITHSDASNLRVVTENTSITLKGVLDA